MADDESTRDPRPLVCVVVLGDIGRSPRMRYHAASLVKEGYDVQLVGYEGTLIPEIDQYPGRISVSYVEEQPPTSGSGLVRIFSYFWKVLLLTVSLLGALSWRGNHKPSCVLVQNPPSIPALPVLWFYSVMIRSRFIVDWHNYGFTILALALKQEHPLVKLCRWTEFTFGKRAHASFCVTKALAADLKKRGVTDGAVTLYDRPGAKFKALSDEEKVDFLVKIGAKYPKAFLVNKTEEAPVNRFVGFKEDGTKILRGDRPGLVVSSTSWTEDEDFQMFLTALELYDAKAVKDSCLPELVVVITGKGPLKERFIELIELMPWKRVKVVTPWLEEDDYPLMLGSADLGVSLHSSSSGLDLPMKVVDMFGAGLPVAALGFECIGELVQDKKNGIIFGNASELAQALFEWFDGDSFRQLKPDSFHMNCRKRALLFAARNWHANWKEIALPVIRAT